MINLNGRYKPEKCPCCSGANFACVHIYDDRPKGETKFELGGPYFREIWKCDVCGHFLSVHDLDLESLYEADYVDSTYGGADGIRANYERIMGMDPAKSDNVGRVERIIEFSKDYFNEEKEIRILDIGSGLGVFFGLLRKSVNWDCTAIEPDPRFARHVRDVLGVHAISDDFLEAEFEHSFEIITLNKVLEHVADPVAMLKKCRDHLTEEGFIYVELPDGAAAAKDVEGFGREEFFIEHFHAFTKQSLELLSKECGLEVKAIETLREPSSKYTVYSFMTKQPKS